MHPPDNVVSVQLMLADFAQIAGGKLFISGGGWNLRAPAPGQVAIAGTIVVPWDQANIRHSLRITLMDDDDHPIIVPTPLGNQEYRIEAQFEAGRPPGLLRGTDLAAPFCIQVLIPELPLGRYHFRAFLGDRRLEIPALSFNVVQMGGQQPHA